MNDFIRTNQVKYYKDIRAKNIARRSLIRRLFLITAAIAIFYIFAESGYQMQIATLKDEVNKVWISTLQPAGGIKNGSGVIVEAPYLIDSMCIDTGPCPSVELRVLVPINKSMGRASLMQTITKAEGYTAPANENNDYELNSLWTRSKGDEMLTFSFMSTNDIRDYQKPTTSIPDNKEWVYLSIQNTGAETISIRMRSIGGVICLVMIIYAFKGSSRRRQLEQ